MIPQVREELLYILKNIPRIINNPSKLSDLSNYTIHSASIYQDSDSISMAVVVYAFSKMISRYEPDKFNTLYPKISDELSNAEESLEKEDYQAYRKHIRDMMFIISKADKDLKLYIEEVLDKAKIKKGSKLYEQGLSAERAAKLMGVSVWEMMNYLGKTTIIDEHNIKSDVKAKIKLAQEIFNFS